MARLWECCFPGNEHKPKIPSISLQEASRPGPSVNDCRKEEINMSPPLWRLTGTRKLVGLHTFPFSIKEAWIQLRQDIPLGHKSTIFSVCWLPE